MVKISPILSFLKRHKIKSILFLILSVAYYFCLPSPLFDKPYSTVIESKDGHLLGAKIATDGQWRFPEQDSIPYKFEKSILYFEDQHFYKHWGLNPIAIIKAFVQNAKAGKIVRGGSTLTQQTIRLARDGKKRSYFEKLIEAIQATRLEFSFSKKRILSLYASQAPFGGNVVGLDMAAWRYFGVSPQQLSWAESVTLAVLPNAPSLIYPGKNHEILLAKRNRLLKKLHENNIIDKETYELALEERLPQKPYELPQVAAHLLEEVSKKAPGERIQTTLNYDIQQRANQIAKSYYNQYSQSEIYNLAILVVDVKTRNIVSYVGNSPTTTSHQKDVDIIQAPRGTGSILKPFLYAAAIDDAELLSETLVPDIPTTISGYSPKNYSLSYEGAVPANRALSRSLNIPSVLMLQNYGVYRFYEQLQRLKLHHINKHPNHYGLSLILGGAESSLWDLCQAYAGLSSSLNYYIESRGEYRDKEIVELNWNTDISREFGNNTFQKEGFGAGAIWQTFEAMREVNRPEGDEAWKFYDSSLQIAWKTGTSYGNRDGWAIGVNKDYVVGVWVGNATGEGRPSLTGVSSAAPILFDVFNLLPRTTWFETPYNDLEEAAICIDSGYLAQENCPSKQGWVVARAKKTKVCPYHFLVHLDAAEQYRINSSCEAIEHIHAKSWFQIPPIQAFYYKNYHVDYVDLPPYREDCITHNASQLDFIYPKHLMRLYLAKDFRSELQPFVAKAASSSGNKSMFWYLNEEYLGATTNFHEFEILAPTGTHRLSIMDTYGNEKMIEIYVEGK